VVAEWCGVSRHAVAKWLARDVGLPEPDVAIKNPGGAVAHGWLPERRAEIEEWNATRKDGRWGRDA
jgi:hypothetical protein